MKALRNQAQRSLAYGARCMTNGNWLKECAAQTAGARERARGSFRMPGPNNTVVWQLKKKSETAALTALTSSSTATSTSASASAYRNSDFASQSCQATVRQLRMRAAATTGIGQVKCANMFFFFWSCRFFPTLTKCVTNATGLCFDWVKAYAYRNGSVKFNLIVAFTCHKLNFILVGFQHCVLSFFCSALFLLLWFCFVTFRFLCGRLAIYKRVCAIIRDSLLSLGLIYLHFVLFDLVLFILQFSH